jgi:methyl-accepting chemotaxis protein
MEWSELVPYVFGFMALAIAGWVARSIEKMSESMDELRDSVSELNKNMAVVAVQVSEHDRRISKLEDGD